MGKMEFLIIEEKQETDWGGAYYTYEQSICVCEDLLVATQKIKKLSEENPSSSFKYRMISRITKEDYHRGRI